MSKKIVKYEVPTNEEELDAMANRIYTYGGPHITGPDADWTDIPLPTWTAFRSALMAWSPAYAACKVPHLPGHTAPKNLAKGNLRSAIDDLIMRGLCEPPRTLEDLLNMGFHERDSTRTPVEKIDDFVDIDTILNGVIPGTHDHTVHYRILGHPTRAKAPYQMAIFQVYVRGPADPEPVLKSEEPWGPDQTCMNEPFEVSYEPQDMGKTAYYRARWQVIGGVRGGWSMATAIIP